MRVLVTGGLGYVGRAVTAELTAQGHEVTVLSSRAKPVAGVEPVRCDLRDRAEVAAVVDRGGFDGVCHLAALVRGRDSVADPLTYFDVNVTGTVNLLMAIQRAARPPTRVVFSSTSIVYGSRHSGALDETVPPRPETPYGASKVAAEELVAAFAATGAIGAVTLRPFNIAGAVDGAGDTDPTRIIPNALRAATGELPYVTLNGDGSALRDFVHVADVATAVRLALDAASPGTCPVYPVGSGVGTSMRQVIDGVAEVTGRPVPVRQLPPKPEPHTLIADPATLRAELGWAPVRSSLPEILRSAWEAWGSVASDRPGRAADGTGSRRAGWR